MNVRRLSYKSLDASGESASRNQLDAAKGALIRAAASTLTLDRAKRVFINRDLGRRLRKEQDHER